MPLWRSKQTDGRMNRKLTYSGLQARYPSNSNYSMILAVGFQGEGRGNDTAPKLHIVNFPDNLDRQPNITGRHCQNRLILRAQKS